MITTERKIITVEATINAPIEKVWERWTQPIHIIHWNYALDAWQSPTAENDLRVGGRFNYRMEARDGSMGFDFYGVYTKVDVNKALEYTLGDDRRVKITFTANGENTIITEDFEAEHENSVELQQSGWQAILNNFKKYAEDEKLVLLHFEIVIDANVDKVYKTMLGDKIWNDWTSVFNSDSHFVGSWDKNAKIMFLGTDQNGKIGGMVARIKENIPNKFVSIEYKGIVNDNKEEMTGPEVEEWAGGLENYSFVDLNGKTKVLVDTDANQNYKSYFTQTWPKALLKLKEICEK